MYLKASKYSLPQKKRRSGLTLNIIKIDKGIASTNVIRKDFSNKVTTLDSFLFFI